MKNIFCRLQKVFLVIIGLSISLSACGKKAESPSSAENNMITVTAHPLSSALYFSGIIQPLKTVAITSPVEGIIDEMAFHYGDSVGANQSLFFIASEKFKTEYKNVLLQYVKAKNELSSARGQLTESEFLHKNQLISDDDFKVKQSSYYNAKLALVQAQDALSILMKQLSLPESMLKQLAIENVDKVVQIMHVPVGLQRLPIVSSQPGLVLLPTKNSGSEEAKPLQKGDFVKQGELLAVIGDMRGLSVRIHVNEFTINQLKIGQIVFVTPTALPSMVLRGRIARLDSQGQSGNGGIPLFAVDIHVPTLTAREAKGLHVGMSAAVAIHQEDPSCITIPLTAIIQRDNLSYVKVQDKTSGKLHEVLVKTGHTTMDGVVVEAGLHVGERIVTVV